MSKTKFISIMLLVAIIGSVVLSCKSKFNKSFSLSINSTNPYDIKFFYDQLTKDSTQNFYFMESSWYFDQSLDGEYRGEDDIEYEVDSLMLPVDSSHFSDVTTNERETYVVVSRYFEPEGKEIQAIKDYVAQGNIAFVSSFFIGTEFKDSLLYFVDNDFARSSFPPFLMPDTLRVNWLGDSTVTPFLYPGHVPIVPALDSATLFSDTKGYRVSSFDTLMLDDRKLPIILRLNVGKGRLYLCSNPIVLSNYFLLHKENYRLANLLYEELELANRNLLWDKYYNSLSKKRNEADSESQLWKIINQYPGFKWAFYTLLVGALLYFMMYSRRIVQEVPILPKNKNNAKAYIRTLAGVYWQRGDDNSIAHKLFHQFYEYLYMQHQINASEVKEENIDRICSKIGKSPEAFRNVLNALQDYNGSKKINKEQLNRYYKYLSIFYQS
ncbi:hypothetical protein SAMN06298216_1622 [Spirosomataceae bacterium TFI 002]|nr:hypothetical protein SAMN06298216_1622 [Spirosomataceae bacterium TFI 002]